jgi:hypothetical protein
MKEEIFWVCMASKQGLKRKGEGSLTSNGERPVRQERSNAIGRGAKETVEYSARGTTATALIDYCRQPKHSYISSFITWASFSS